MLENIDRLRRAFQLKVVWGRAKRPTGFVSKRPTGKRNCLRSGGQPEASFKRSAQHPGLDVRGFAYASARISWGAGA